MPALASAGPHLDVPDRWVPRAAVLAATALAIGAWALPGLLHPSELAQDAAGHLAAAQYARDHLLPAWSGWNPNAFGGFPQDVAYPPLAHVALALLGLALPIELAFRALLALAVAATPLAAYRFGRGHGLGAPRAALFTLAATAILSLPATISGHDELTGTWPSIYGIGLFANGLGLPLFLLAGAELPRALATGRVRRAACLCALTVLTHMVCGIALAALAAAEVASALAGRRPRAATLGAAARLLAWTAALAAFWLVPFAATLGYGPVYHLPSERPPLVVAALLAALGAQALLAARRPALARRTAPLAVFIAGVGAFLCWGDLQGTALHLYRFNLFLALGAAALLAALPAGRWAIASAGLAALVLAFALAREAPQRAFPAPLALDVPADLADVGRVLVVADPSHQPSSQYLQHEFARASGRPGVVGLFVESSPMGRWVGDMLREISLTSYLWGTPFDAEQVVVVARDVQFRARPADDGGVPEGQKLLLRHLADFAITHVLTDRVLPDAVADNAGPVVCRSPVAGAPDADCEAADGCYVFRLRKVRAQAPLASLVRARIEPLAWRGLEPWFRDVGAWWFRPDAAASLPVVARPGLGLAPAGDEARIVSASAGADGSRHELEVAADEPAPILVRVAWHPWWRATADGEPIAVDRAAPGWCLVRGRGQVVLELRRPLAANCAALLSVAAAIALAAGAARRALKPA